MGTKKVVRIRVGEMEVGEAEPEQTWETRARRLEQLCRKTCPPSTRDGKPHTYCCEKTEGTD